jgi:hypothetical protein
MNPPGRGGIGIVRLAGPQAKAIAKPMLRLSHDLEPGRATVCDLVAFPHEAHNDYCNCVLESESLDHFAVALAALLLRPKVILKHLPILHHKTNIVENFDVG